MFFAWVNPAAPATDIQLNDRRGRRLRPGLGRLQVGSDLAGYVTLEGLGDLPAPDHNIYEWRADTRPPPAYHSQTDRTHTLVGGVGEVASFVQETRVYTPITLDQLLDAKILEMEAEAALVSVLPFPSTLAGNPHYFSNTPMAQALRAAENAILQDRMKDIVIDGQTKPYWRRDVEYILVRGNNGRRLRYRLNEREWGVLQRNTANHVDRVQDSVTAIIGELDTAHGAADFAALAAIDVTDPARWPDVYRGEVSTSIRRVNSIPGS